MEYLEQRLSSTPHRLVTLGKLKLDQFNQEATNLEESILELGDLEQSILESGKWGEVSLRLQALTGQKSIP